MYFPKSHNISIHLSYSGKSLWYVSSINQWKPFKECSNYPEYSSCYRVKCGSLKALVRKLLKWDVPRNTKAKVILSDGSTIYLSAH